MIEDKELGLKIAQPEEKEWLDLKEKTEERIMKTKINLKIDKLVLELAINKLKEFEDEIKNKN